MKHLYLVRGVPGSGKTTFAAALAKGMNIEHVETDMIRDEWPGGRDAFPWNDTNNAQVHALCLQYAADCIARGKAVVVSNTFCTIERMRPYFQMAKLLGAKVTVLHVEARHGTVHSNVDQPKYEAEWEEYKGELHD